MGCTDQSELVSVSVMHLNTECGCVTILVPLIYLTHSIISDAASCIMWYCWKGQIHFTYLSCIIILHLKVA